MKILLPAISLAALALANTPGCPKKEAPSAKDDMKGKVVFSSGKFDDAKNYKTFDEFKAANKVISEMVVNPPEAHLAYYAVFQDPVGANEYLVQVFDRTEMTPGAVRSETKAAKPETSQVTGGWGFDLPVWPPPEEAEKVAINDVWIKPGHQYEVVILKALARGSFTVAGTIATPAPSPTATATPAKGAKTDKPKPKKKTG
jgi:hypothetical protein